MASVAANPVVSQDEITNVVDLSPSSLSIPALPGKTTQDNEGSAEPKVCPTCNQKVVTNQPGGKMTADEAMEKAAATADLCDKWCSCFGKALENAEKVQQMAGDE